MLETFLQLSYWVSSTTDAYLDSALPYKTVEFLYYVTAKLIPLAYDYLVFFTERIVK